jgi:hypothetical protein
LDLRGGSDPLGPGARHLAGHRVGRAAMSDWDTPR